jgi:hypothetical protein
MLAPLAGCRLSGVDRQSGNGTGNAVGKIVLDTGKSAVELNVGFFSPLPEMRMGRMLAREVRGE